MPKEYVVLFAGPRAYANLRAFATEMAATLSPAPLDLLRL